VQLVLRVIGASRLPSGIWAMHLRAT